ncbi:hypothetical protein PLICRDRAFT_638927 [Plicaturopsis crispa FD-325 SS-3]|nr:hypothetical protein PLICRDRAFT_638927 [Plicaturopsis crispa FD-325 SS-3]
MGQTMHVPGQQGNAQESAGRWITRPRYPEGGCCDAHLRRTMSSRERGCCAVRLNANGCSCITADGTTLSPQLPSTHTGWWAAVARYALVTWLPFSVRVSTLCLRHEALCGRCQRHPGTNVDEARASVCPCHPGVTPRLARVSMFFPLCRVLLQHRSTRATAVERCCTRLLTRLTVSTRLFPVSALLKAAVSLPSRVLIPLATCRNCDSFGKKAAYGTPVAIEIRSRVLWWCECNWPGGLEIGNLLDI